jgi:ribonucleoside-diphosphate reductase alpha chain
MPTASTLKFLEITKHSNLILNIYTSCIVREFIVVNKHLLHDLVERFVEWNHETRINVNGSVQDLDIPQDLKELYKTVWEMSMKDIIDMSRHRGYFVDQSQSLNLFMQNANYSKLRHFMRGSLDWKRNVLLENKSGSWWIKFTLNNDKSRANRSDVQPAPVAAPVAVEAAVETADEYKANWTS